MAEVQRRGKRQAALFFGGAIFLILLNLAGIALAVYAPIYLRTAPEDVLFNVADGTALARNICIFLAILGAIALLQIVYLPRAITKMVEDSEETVRAEIALRWAQRLAYLTILACIASLTITTRTFRSWAEILKNVR